MRTNIEEIKRAAKLLDDYSDFIINSGIESSLTPIELVPIINANRITLNALADILEEIKSNDDKPNDKPNIDIDGLSDTFEKYEFPKNTKEALDFIDNHHMILHSSDHFCSLEGYFNGVYLKSYSTFDVNVYDVLVMDQDALLCNILKLLSWELIEKVRKIRGEVKNDGNAK